MLNLKIVVLIAEEKNFYEEIKVIENQTENGHYIYKP